MRHAPRIAVAAVAAAALISASCGRTGDAVVPTGSSPLAAPPAASASLIGPTWRLVSLEGRPALPGVRVDAVFGDDDRVSGRAGCNSYFGGTAVTGARIDVGLLAATRMYCGGSGDGVMAQEQAYLAALERATSFRVSGSELRLGPSPGAVTLVFQAE